MKIKDPRAASELLDLALSCAKRRQRVIFFCQCKCPRRCHRKVVTSLVLKEARKRGIKVEVAEWPGGTPGKPIIIPVSNLEASKIARGKKSIDLGRQMPSLKLLSLPWASIATIKSDDNQILAIVNAAKCNKGRWFVPLYRDQDASLADLKRRSHRDRRGFGLAARQT